MALLVVKELLCNKKINSSTNKQSQESLFLTRIYKRNKEIDKKTDISTFDQRRTVFVSLIGLFETYTTCPTYVLYSSLLIMPLQKKWIYDISRHKKELESSFNSKLTNQHKDFIEFLRWKDSQNCVFWMADEYQNKGTETEHSLVSPFWKVLSSELTILYDPVSRDTYKQLHLNDEWWYRSFTHAKYNTKRSAILAELYFKTMKCKTIQEIIYQSNPKSLNPVIFYGQCNDNSDFVKDEAEEDGWYIASD
eukprot:517129_1